MLGPRLTLPLVGLLLLAPLAAAEFGHESHDGWPVSVDGTVIRPPVTPLLAEADPVNKQGPVTAYPYYPVLTLEVERLARDHPDLVKLTSAGKSTAGLDLWLLEIADFARIEKGEGLPLAEREVVYLDGGTHSNEYSGVYFVTEIAQFLLDEYETNETAKWIVENRHTWILPMVNPDGSNAFGRLNARTVNINRNFPATWGAIEEMPLLNNPGPEPGSEPETKTVMSILERVQPDYVNSIHCCGNLWLHPWGAEDIPLAPDFQMFQRICDDVFYDVRTACGPIWSTIYPASGTTADQGYGQVGASSWTYEMSGRGAVAAWGQPAITDDVRVQERESWRGVMHAFLNVHKYGALPVIVSLVEDGGKLVATLENKGYGNVTLGNVTIGNARVAIPPLAPGERATLAFDGDFAAGPLQVGIDWQKRAMRSPVEAKILPLQLVEEGGRLVAQFANGDPLGEAGDVEVPSLSIPAPGFAPVAGALATIGLVAARLARRRA